MRYMKFTIGLRYFCTKYSKADSSPALARSITSASVMPVSERSASMAWWGALAIASNPRSMATLLTSD